MQKKHFSLPGRGFAAAGLITALILGIIGTGFLVHRIRFAGVDARAQPFFDEAMNNVPPVVQKMTATGSLFRLGWYMARDKLSGSHRAQEYLKGILRKPILEPCRKGAQIYGCRCDSASFLDTLQEVNSRYTVSQVCAVSGLAMEAIFLKSTMAAVRSVLGAVIGRLFLACGGGSVCALADGPFPVGDVIGVLLAAGGIIWCGVDLYKAKAELPLELTAILQRTILDYQEACRREALK